MDCFVPRNDEDTLLPVRNHSHVPPRLYVPLFQKRNSTSKKELTKINIFGKSADNGRKVSEYVGKSADSGGKVSEYVGKSADNGGKVSEYVGKSADDGGKVS
jgi:hypothetical protein